MARPEITGKKATTTAAAPKAAPDDEEADACSIETFCRRHGFSPKLFYKRPDLMPETFYLSTRRLITTEEQAKWRAKRQAAAKAEAAAAAAKRAEKENA